MLNIKLHYRYRDYANYKNNGEAIFTNPDNLNLETINSALRAKLFDDIWFYVSQWGLKDLHFQEWFDEIDHPFHEFVLVECTEELASKAVTIADFIRKIDDRIPSRTLY